MLGAVCIMLPQASNLGEKKNKGPWAGVRGGASPDIETKKGVLLFARWFATIGNVLGIGEGGGQPVSGAF